MFVHLLVGTLLLALVCFGIGVLAGGPDLVSRRRRARKTLNPPSGTVKAAATTELPSSVQFAAAWLMSSARRLRILAEQTGQAQMDPHEASPE